MLKSLALSAALALAACAAAPDKTTAVKTPVANAKAPAGCVGQTATRIPLKDESTACAGFGSTYSKQDIDSTGQTNLDRALPMLDPAITRH